ncbi:MAG: hypothetical protein V4623_09545 [Pseudomonadota bacterium]
MTHGLLQRSCLVFALALLASLNAAAQSERLSTSRNGSSQRYEVNQTFDGQAFRKDNNIWVYNQEFADLFGMPQQYVEDLKGIAAAAFRIEDASYQECGFGGRADACRKVQECLLDLYFDETKNPLPWATDIKSQWLPWYSSMTWLRPLDRKEKPHGIVAIDAPPGVVRNETLHSQIVAFADPVSKRQAIFITNINISTDSKWTMSGSLPLLGYTKNFYRSLSVVSLQLGCLEPARPEVSINLESKRDVFDPPIARFNQMLLPASFIDRLSTHEKEQRARDSAFYKSLFPPPLGTRGTAPSDSKSNP